MEGVLLNKAAVLSAAEKPPLQPVEPKNIPDELRSYNRWVGWRWEQRKGKWTKPPVNARTGRKADCTDPATWCSFDEAIAVQAAGRVDGIGFALGDADGVNFAGVDLDDCRNSATGKLSSLAREIIATLATYTEVSPSGTGVKLLCLGVLPPGALTKNMDRTVEIYSGGRYFCMTGQRLVDSPSRVENRPAELAGVWKRYIGSEQKESSPKAKHASAPVQVPIGVGVDADALASMLRHKLGKKENDGSRRLLCVACRAVEHDLSDDDAIATIRQYEQTYPFPVSRSDADILQRVRSAEKKAERGKAFQTIDTSERDLATVTPKAWKALQKANRPPTLFRFGGTASRIEAGDHGEPIITQLDPKRCRHHLARAAKWVKWTERDGEVYIAPPMNVVNDVLASPDHPLPVLTRIVEAPVFALDGTLQTLPGYHPASRTYYVPVHGLVVPDVPERPTAEDIAMARTFICDDLLGDFPFTGEPERAHAVALLLLPFARALIAGPTPLHLFEKPAPGTGATLLVDLLCVLATGRAIPTMTEAREEEEWRKRITAVLRSSAQFVLIDNLRQPLDSAAVASVLTATTWEDRILGVSDVARLPVQCCWVATANNPVLSLEIARRTVRIRMDAKMERPWLRTEFRHSNLRQWVDENRGLLIGSALTLIRAWIVAGRPKGEMRLGMYERWSEVMGGVLTTAGVPGFLTNLCELYDEADAESASWRSFLTAWWERFNSKPTAVKDLWKIVKGEVYLPLEGSEHSQRVTLGKMLSDRRDRVFDMDGGSQKWLLRRGEQRQGAYQWQLVLAA